MLSRCVMALPACDLEQQCLLSYAFLGVQAAAERDEQSSSNEDEEDQDLFEAMQLVQELHQMSSELAADASEDDYIFSKAADTKKASNARRGQ